MDATDLDCDFSEKVFKSRGIVIKGVYVLCTTDNGCDIDLQLTEM